MSGWAGDKDRKAPLAALLILFGLLLGAGSVTNAEGGLRAPGARLAQSGKVAAHVLPGSRAILSDEEARPDAQPFAPPAGPAIIPARSSPAVLKQAANRSFFNPHLAPTARYRARAPPAA